MNTYGQNLKKDRTSLIYLTLGRQGPNTFFMNYGLPRSANKH